MEGLFGLMAALMSSSSASAGQAYAVQNQQKQMELAEKQYRLSTAGRKDPFGNKTSYNDATNEWDTELTPSQNQLVKGGEREQLRSLLEDAPRNRAIRERAHERGLQAAEPYNEAYAGFRYDKPKSEAAIRDELTSLLTTQASLGAKTGQDRNIREALRYGKREQIPAIVKATDDELGAGLQQREMQGRQGAVTEAASRQQQHDARYLPQMKELAALMDAGGDMPPRFSTLPESSLAQQSDMSKGVLGALASASGNLNNASQLGLTASKNAAPDFRGIAAMMNAFNKGGKTGTQEDNGFVPGGRKASGNQIFDMDDEVLDSRTYGNDSWGEMGYW